MIYDSNYSSISIWPVNLISHESQTLQNKAEFIAHFKSEVHGWNQAKLANQAVVSSLAEKIRKQK